MVFSVEAEEDGTPPIERAAGLLAMHSLAAHRAPDEYTMTADADICAARAIAGRARNEILLTRRAVGCGDRLTRREMQVLRGVEEMLSNKEIGARLNIAERTVKFHVSSLLLKFGVRGRGELAMASLGEKTLESNSHEGERG